MAKMWDLNFVRVRYVGMNFDIWCHVISKGPQEIVRRMTFVTVV